MSFRKTMGGAALAILAAAFLVALPVQASPPAGGQVLSWTISNATIVSSGKTTNTPEGILTTGYILEAAAKAKDAGLVPEGTFRLELSAFRPSKDLPGQKAGVWHLVGQWTITDKNAPEPQKAARHSQATIRGSLSAAIPFNPATKSGDVAARVQLPMSPAAGRWARGEGRFTGNSSFEGQLVLNATIGPDLHGRAR